MKGDRKFAPLFEVRWVDAVPGEDGGWTWNESRVLFEFRTAALDLRRAFTSRLRRFVHESRFFSGELGRGWFRVEGDWDLLELVRRADGCPFYACIRMSS